ncbi:MAG: DUF4340 domain-containing protein [Planctomyces sp.]|nr:DUF4340 domain-containing protein [Planctomyces sp.]
MSQVNRTLLFLVAGVCSVSAAAVTHYSLKPRAAAIADQVGEPFFPEFTEPARATSLRVAAYNAKTARVDAFAVDVRDGVWRIPSHHNYPADGKDRLARTAASLIGVTRGQLASQTADAHARLKVLDPLNRDNTSTEGIGSRITISAGDQVLADYIIGDRAGEGDRYYVRSPGDDRVYISEIRPDLSTRFVDWITPNLLEATSSSFRELVLDRYRIDDRRGVLVEGERSVLKRESASADWKLEGLDDPSRKVKTSVVNAMLSSLSNMKIVGVRPKPAGLGAQLKGQDDARLSPIDQLDMQGKGYFIDSTGALRSNEGDFIAGTSDGALYVLRFGKVFTGSDVEIEIGGKAGASEEGADAAGETDDAKTEADDAKADGDSPDRQENRYVFITVQFDEGLLGQAPVEPAKPTPPEGTSAIGDGRAASLAGPPADAPLTDPETVSETADAGDETAVESQAPAAQSDADAAEAPADSPANEGEATESPADGTDIPVTPAQPPAADPQAEYEAALKTYEQELDEYRVRKQDWDERVRKGQELVERLNNRFADWYYVIPADVFEDLSVAPEDLLEPVVPDDSEGGLPDGVSNLPGFQESGAEEETAPPATDDPLPDGTPEATDESPATEAPAAEAAGSEGDAVEGSLESTEPAVNSGEDNPS